MARDMTSNASGVSESADAGSPSSRADGFRLSHTAAFALQVSMLVVFLSASIAPTPLYATYQAEWGFSSAVITAIFGIYAVTVLVALLTIGGLSDYIGRRPMLFVGIALQVIALIVYLTASGASSLFVARVIQGVAGGAVLGAVGAGLLDLDREKGTIANGMGATAGTAIGALVAGVFVAFLPIPTHLVYVVLLFLVIAQGVGVWFMRETASARPGAFASLRPQLGIPPNARLPFVLAVPTFVSLNALIGFYASLGPAVARAVTGSNSAFFGGLALFALSGAGSVSVLLTRNGAPLRLQVVGSVALIVGVVITETAVGSLSIGLFLLGTVIAGAGFGAAYQGALRTVLPLAQLHARAGLVSAIYVVCYLALGIPALIAGVLATHGDLIATTRGYGLVVIGLAALPLIVILARTRSRRELLASERSPV